MNWASLYDFIDMGGYGFYVWSAYGVALLVWVLEARLAVTRFKRARAQLANPHLSDMHLSASNGAAP